MSRLTDELMNSAPWASTEERAEWWRNKCHEVFEELEHYRHLEEQGRLIVQKHGQWKPTGNIEVLYAKEYACSVCGGIMLGKSEFCPDCGAKLAELKGTEE